MLNYCAHELDPALTRHIQLCPACRSAVESHELLRAALDSWDHLPVSHDFDARLFQRIREDERPGWAARAANWFTAASWKPAIPAAAIFALWMIAFPSKPDAVPSADAAQAEQVERALEDLDMLQQLQFHPK